MNLVEIQQLYRDEVERRDQLIANMAVPLGVVTVLGALLAGLADRMEWSRTCNSVTVGLFIAVSSVGLVAAVYCLVRAMVGYTNERPPYPAVLREVERDLAKWHQEQGSASGVALAEFDEYLIGAYTAAADRHARNNVLRSAWHHRANLSLVLCLVGIGLAIPFVILNVKNQPQRTQDVRVVAFPHQHTEQTQMPEPTKPTTPPPTQRPKPTLPPNVEFKEGQIDKTRKK